MDHLHQRQAIVIESLYFWCDWQGIIYYELLPYGQPLNYVHYCEHLNRLKLVIKQKRPALLNWARNRVSPGYRQAAHIFDEALQALEAQMGSYFASNLQSRLRTK
uniref:Histonelysine Nmethyltransferase SETMARlike [Bombus terrestris] n=1 Tax=Lepeophtheirus salmonis TaxID=72036 RepID=A0A0K2TUY4_LEPSM